MATNDFDLYVDDCIALAKSLVVKSQQTIAASNRHLASLQHGISDDPMAWSYYLHLRGEYYLPDGYTPETMGLISPFGYDTVMWIRDLDASPTEGVYPEIIYSKSTLAARPITLSEYGKRSHLYKALIEKYPTQEKLIERILNPVPDDVVERLVDQPDGTIAYWDASLVEDQETMLIPELQERLNLILKRWDNNAYAVSDRYFAAAKLTMLIHAVVSCIINIRDKWSQSPYAHSFHIWGHLGNYYGLDRYKGSLPIQQALWLRRNIDRIAAVGGSDGVLDWLEEEFARPYGLKLTKLDLRKDPITLLSEYMSAPKVAKRDYVSSERDEINYRVSSVEDTLLRLERAGVLNSQHRHDDRKAVEVGINKIMDTSVPTGVIECEPFDNYSNLFLDQVQQKIKLWSWLAINDKFLFTFPLSIPGKGDVVVSAKEALAIFLYCASVETGEPFINIPTLRILEIPQWPMDSEGNDLSVDDVKALFRKTVEAYNVTDELLDAVTLSMEDIRLPVDPITTVEEYSGYIDRVISRMEYHALLITSSNSATLRSELTSTILLLYGDQFKAEWLGVDTYSEFFSSIQVDLSTINVAEAMQIVKNITIAIFGNMSIEEGLPSPYFEMMQIIRTLSSYTLTFIAGGDGHVTRRIDPPSFYPTNTDYTIDFDGYLPTVDMDYPFEVTDVEHTFSPTSITSEMNDVNVNQHQDIACFGLGEYTMGGADDLAFDHGIWQGSAYGSDMEVETQWSSALPMNQDVVGARWGYSFYKIEVAAPFCMRVRRGGQDIDPSKDGDVMDVGFVGERADEEAMLNFMNAYASPGNGWLEPVYWYDQTPQSSALYNPLDMTAYINSGKHLLFTGSPRIGRNGALIKTTIEKHGIEELMIALPNGSSYYQNDVTQLNTFASMRSLAVYLRVATLDPIADVAHTSSPFRLLNTSGTSLLEVSLSNADMAIATRRISNTLSLSGGKLTMVNSSAERVPVLASMSIIRDFRTSYCQVRTLARVGGNDTLAVDGSMHYAERVSNLDTGTVPATQPLYLGGVCTDEDVELLIGQLIIIRAGNSSSQHRSLLPNYLIWRNSTMLKHRFERQKGAGYGTVILSNIDNKNWMKAVMRRRWSLSGSLSELNSGTNASFTRHGGKYRFGDSGLELIAALNTPDYDSVGGVRLDNIVNNAIDYSYQLSNAAWVKTNIALPAHALPDTLGIIRHFTATADGASANYMRTVNADSVRFIRQMVIVDGAYSHFTMTVDNGTAGHAVTVRFDTSTLTATEYSTVGTDCVLVAPGACRVVKKVMGYGGMDVYLLEMDVKITGTTTRIWIHPGQLFAHIHSSNDRSYHLGTENSTWRGQPILTNGAGAYQNTESLSVTTSGILEGYTLYFEYTPTYEYLQNPYLTMTETLLSLPAASSMGCAIYRKGDTLEIALNNTASTTTFSKVHTFVVGQTYRVAFSHDYNGSFVTSDFNLVASLAVINVSPLGSPAPVFGPMTGSIKNVKFFSYASSDLDAMQAATTI